MINLQDLEREIDALIDSETETSLREWFKNNRTNNVDCYVDFEFSGGTYQNMSANDCNFEIARKIY